MSGSSDTNMGRIIIITGGKERRGGTVTGGTGGTGATRKPKQYGTYAKRAALPPHRPGGAAKTIVLWKRIVQRHDHVLHAVLRAAQKQKEPPC